MLCFVLKCLLVAITPVLFVEYNSCFFIGVVMFVNLDSDVQREAVPIHIPSPTAAAPATPRNPLPTTPSPCVSSAPRRPPTAISQKNRRQTTMSTRCPAIVSPCALCPPPTPQTITTTTMLPANQKRSDRTTTGPQPDKVRLPPTVASATGPDISRKFGCSDSCPRAAVPLAALFCSMRTHRRRKRRSSGICCRPARQSSGAHWSPNRWRPSQASSE